MQKEMKQMKQHTNLKTIQPNIKKYQIRYITKSQNTKGLNTNMKNTERLNTNLTI